VAFKDVSHDKLKFRDKASASPQLSFTGATPPNVVAFSGLAAAPIEAVHNNQAAIIQVKYAKVFIV
jgi:hypothetical protein